MDIKSLFKSNAQRRVEALDIQMSTLFALTAAVPGDTLPERFANLLPAPPVVRPGIPPMPMTTIEAVNAAGY